MEEIIRERKKKERREIVILSVLLLITILVSVFVIYTAAIHSQLNLSKLDAKRQESGYDEHIFQRNGRCGFEYFCVKDSIAHKIIINNGEIYFIIIETGGNE